ncbi:unnamed protein product, partial [Iphiclides podalirius]
MHVLSYIETKGTPGRGGGICRGSDGSRAVERGAGRCGGAARSLRGASPTGNAHGLAGPAAQSSSRRAHVHTCRRVHTASAPSLHDDAATEHPRTTARDALLTARPAPDHPQQSPHTQVSAPAAKRPTRRSQRYPTSKGAAGAELVITGVKCGVRLMQE